jgi:hypothetical protein
MDAVIKDEFIMDHARAVDWRVLHAIEIHQGYKTWFCRISLDRIAKVARCSKRTACTSSRWWGEMGVLKITRRGKFNEYKIVQDFRHSPGIVHRPRTFSQKQQERGPRGKYAPSTDIHSSPLTDIPNVTTGGNYNNKSSSEVFLQDPPHSPTGGSGPTSEEKSGSRLPSSTVRSAPPPEGEDFGKGNTQGETAFGRFLRESKEKKAMQGRARKDRSEGGHE